MWDPGQYLRFGDERSRPFFELTAQDPGRGSPGWSWTWAAGPASSPPTLARRWPDAEVRGLDSSAEMIAAAQRSSTTAGSGLSFGLGDLRDWRPERPVDVIVSNAVLQWVPGHLRPCCRAGPGARRRGLAGLPGAGQLRPAEPRRSCASWPGLAAGVALLADVAAEPAVGRPGRVPRPARPGSAARWTRGRRRTCMCCRARSGAGVVQGHRPAAGARGAGAGRRRPRSWPSTGRGCARPTRPSLRDSAAVPAGVRGRAQADRLQPSASRAGLTGPRAGGSAPRARCAAWGRARDSPFQARFTRCAATSSSFGLRASSHHWPVKATMPTSICAYTGASFGS